MDRIRSLKKQRSPAIIVHGGAWAVPDRLVEQNIKGVEESVKEGWKILSSGGAALDAVERAVNVMEDNPVFDAGLGSVLNEDGEVELDAMIMDGENLDAGAVAGVKNIKNPVSLSRKIMEETEHVMIIGEGANRLAREWGFEEVSYGELGTEEALNEWERYKRFTQTVSELYRRDTVGAVAFDSSGNIAAATSTGGITAKKAGRVGDVPIIGSGAYADNSVGGACSTGHGESIMKVMLARLVLSFIEKGYSVNKAARIGLNYMKRKVDGHGGIILINSDSEIGHYYTTKRMPWAKIKEGKVEIGI